MLLLQDKIAISNGAACSSAAYTHSHVLEAMGLGQEIVQAALRISWYHDSPEVEWTDLFRTIANLL